MRAGKGGRASSSRGLGPDGSECFSGPVIESFEIRIAERRDRRTVLCDAVRALDLPAGGGSQGRQLRKADSVGRVAGNEKVSRRREEALRDSGASFGLREVARLLVNGATSRTSRQQEPRDGRGVGLPSSRWRPSSSSGHDELARALPPCSGLGPRAHTRYRTSVHLSVCLR
jgi:hypothetical protein